METLYRYINFLAANGKNSYDMRYLAVLCMHQRDEVRAHRASLDASRERRLIRKAQATAELPVIRVEPTLEFNELPPMAASR